MNFPLPISNNFKLFNYTFKDGSFAECSILWPANFIKQGQTMNKEHVFILKNRQNHYFHVYWKWDEKEPRLLVEKYWENCFEKSKHTSITNRYLFNAHGQSLLLPYVPHTLHRRWKNVSIYQRDDSYIASCFLKYFDIGIFDNKKKRFERFPGWVKKQLRNTFNEYSTYIALNKSKNIPINLTKKIQDLTKDERVILDQACAILHAVFPRFSTDLTQ